MNNEGLEKIVDITDGFKELAFASVPVFDKDQGDKHFYFNKLPLKLGDTLSRLKRKY